MMALEFKEITPEQDDWITQKVLYGYYGSIRLGSLFVIMRENLSPTYGYEIDGQIEDLPDSDLCETWEDAERVFLDVMFDYLDDQESYYNELKHMCNELIKERQMNNG
jgi:hypothetical protein